MEQRPDNWFRRELKYVLSETQAAAISAYVRPLVPPDVHAPGGVYPIVSLYLDSADLRLCHESLEGAKNRFKLRVRSYSDAPVALCSVEIKRRINRVIAKSRAWVPRAAVPALLAGRHRAAAVGSHGTENLAQFLYYAAQLQAAPVVRVRYLRQAYECPDGNHLRITLDRALQFSTTQEPDVRLGGRGWQPLAGGPIVLEIKFNGQFPGWLSRIIGVLGLQERSFSKYALSVTQACRMRFCAPRLAEASCHA